MKQQVKDDGKDFASLQSMIIQILFHDFEFSLFPQILGLNGNGKIIPISLFYLYDDTDCHGLMRKGHSDDLMQVGTRKLNSLNYRTQMRKGTYFDKSKLFDMIIPYQDIILVAADAGRNLIYLYLFPLFIHCLVLTQKMLVISLYLFPGDINTEVMQVALVCNDVQIYFTLD